MNERKIIYLVNPVSGTAKKDALLKHIQRTNNEHKIEHEIYFTEANCNYHSIKNKIQKQNFTDVVIVGGDGTVSQVVNALRKTHVQFGIIPSGSGNGLAFAAAIPKNYIKALDIILQGNSKPVDAFFINQYFSVNLSGIGFDAKVAHHFAEKNTRGLFTYTQQTLLHYFNAGTYAFEILVDDFSFKANAFFISMANSNQFGNNVTITPKASLNDGLLDVVIVQKMNKIKLPFAVLQQIKGNNKIQLMETISKESIIYFQTPALKIRNINLAPLHVDGEPKQTAKEFTVEIIKDCFELMQP